MCCRSRKCWLPRPRKSPATRRKHRSLCATPYDQKTQEKRLHLNADQRTLQNLDAEKIKSRDEFYRALNRLNRAALCCSGGGQRSADVLPRRDSGFGRVRHRRSRGAGGGAAPIQRKSSRRSPRQSRRSRCSATFIIFRRSPAAAMSAPGCRRGATRGEFQHRHREPDRPAQRADIEPPEISWLRAYSNYLTPRLGISSADGWAAVAIFVRNLILNWLVIIPSSALVLLA